MQLPPASSFPVPFSETWRSVDSTKLKEFMRCPRRFFYRYVLGWQLEAAQESLHLVFGQAWHLAMEHMLKGLAEQGGYNAKLVIEAYELLRDCYYASFSPEQEEAFNSPKNPANALQALTDYAQRFAADHRDFKVLHTEIAGTVPVGDDRQMVYKIDAIIQDLVTNLVAVLEHKTSQQLTHNWSDQWILSPQVGTYCHALYCLKPSEQVYGARVNGTFLRKKGNDFMRVPVRQTPEMMQRWLEMVNHYFDNIEFNFEQLCEETPEKDIMQSFPMNTEACMDWGKTCPYHDFCVSWNNPLRRANEELPGGFEVRHWDPLAEHAKTATIVEIPIEGEGERDESVSS